MTNPTKVPEKKIRCSNCFGSGTVRKSAWVSKLCPNCNGTGNLIVLTATVPVSMNDTTSSCTILDKASSLARHKNIVFGPGKDKGAELEAFEPITAPVDGVFDENGDLDMGKAGAIIDSHIKAITGNKFSFFSPDTWNSALDEAIKVFRPGMFITIHAYDCAMESLNQLRK